MSIIRVQKRSRYACISKALLEDSRLSWSARGLLSFLLSKPDKWEVSVAHLIDCGPDGKDKVYSILKELSNAGYLVKQLGRKGGKFTGDNWSVYESPYPENPDTVKASPYPEKPHPENPPLVITEDSEYEGTNNTQSKSTLSGANNTPRVRAREVSFNPLSISLPDWLTPECWQEWVAHRASLKKPVKTLSTAQAILKTLDKLRDEGSLPEDVVLQSIANGWQGLFPVKQTSKGSSNDNRKFSKRTEHHYAMSRYQDECVARAFLEEELDRSAMETLSGDLRRRLVSTVGNA